MANKLERLEAFVKERLESVTVYNSPGLLDDAQHAESCEQCAKHFRSSLEQMLPSRAYAGALDCETVSKLATTFTDSIFRDLEYLRQKISSYGNILISRWRKKSEAQRRAIILQAWPNLYVKKAPQVHLLYTRDRWAARLKYRNAHLLPYLTVDNICADKSKFINLLHYRTCHGPQEWVMFDSEQVQDGYCQGLLQITYSSACVVMHGEGFGTLVQWDRKAAHAWGIVGWPRAQLILEAQARLMCFLRKTVDVILDDCQGATGSEKWHDAVTAGLSAQGGQEHFSALISQAFSAPPVFDVKELEQLARARAASGEDELWLLQTDPAYAELRITQLRNMKCTKAYGKADAVGWCAIAGQLTVHATHRAQMWRWIHQELSYLCQLEDTNAEPLTAGGPVPREYAMVHGSLQTLVANAYLQFRDLLRSSFRYLPDFQHIFEYSAGAEPGLMNMSTRHQSDEMLESEPLLWAVIYLLDDDETAVIKNKSFYFGFIEDSLAKAEAKSKTRIGQLLAEFLADLAATLTILSALESRRPVVSKIGKDESVRIHSGRYGPMSAWRNCTKNLKGDASGKSAIGQALQGFAEASWPKGARDQTWLARADRSRQALSHFWGAVELDMRRMLDTSGRADEDVGYQLALYRFHLQPEHVANVEAERERILSACAAKAQRQRQLLVPVWDTVPLVSENAASSIRNSSEHARKKKRRDQLAPPETTPEIEETAAQQPIRPAPDHVAQTTLPQEPLTVSGASFRLFKSMFSTDTTTNFKWVQLVAAMVDAGCSATQNGGSAVTFKHTTGSIAFHRPHPDPTVDPVMLHAMGKRLGKRFGWHLKVFREREKGVAEKGAAETEVA